MAAGRQTATTQKERVGCPRGQCDDPKICLSVDVTMSPASVALVGFLFGNLLGCVNAHSETAQVIS